MSDLIETLKEKRANGQNVTPKEYSGFVRKLASKKSMKNFNAKLGTAGLGLAGEAGEIGDIVKKLLFHEMEFTDEIHGKLVKEAGDVLWYLDFLCDKVLGVSIQDIMNLNVDKLLDRYKSGQFTKQEFMKKEKRKKE